MVLCQDCVRENWRWDSKIVIIPGETALGLLVVIRAHFVASIALERANVQIQRAPRIASSRVASSSLELRCQRPAIRGEPCTTILPPERQNSAPCRPLYVNAHSSYVMEEG